jgi:hypothetical protein
VVVEHIFITTLPHEEAFTRADETLASLGFIGPLDPSLYDASQPAVRTAPSVITRDWKRGHKKAKRNAKHSDLPQHARVEFDRGRITLALSVEIPFKQDKLHSEMLVSIAKSLELRLSKDASVTDSLTPADAIQAIIDKKARRATIGRAIAISFLVLFVLGIVALGIFAASHP